MRSTHDRVPARVVGSDASEVRTGTTDMRASFRGARERGVPRSLSNYLKVSLEACMVTAVPR